MKTDPVCGMQIDPAKAAGTRTVMFVAVDGKPAGLVGVADPRTKGGPTISAPRKRARSSCRTGEVRQDEAVRRV